MALFEPQKLRLYGNRDLKRLPQLQNLPDSSRFEMAVVSSILPFRSNNYVVENLIDWSRIPEDPIFQLTFPQRGMVCDRHFQRMASVLRQGGNPEQIRSTAADIAGELNPHPEGQKTANVPLLDDKPVPGMQHKYRETCLVFPARGQTCHAYCTFCFRWPQFSGLDGQKFATDENRRFVEYIRRHREITDVLFTGGDPMVMRASRLREMIAPLLHRGFEHVQTVRIGSKSLAYWPHRFVTDPDADEILRLFERVVASGRHLSFMAHFNHWVELETDVVQEAIRRIRNTGAEIRCQSPLVRHINDSPMVWSRMWQKQVSLGCIPYYMFIERDTGARRYFEIPLARAWEVFQHAYQRVSGLARSVRGPSMSANPGKVLIDGITEIKGEKVFALQLLQGRSPDWVRRPFFAKFDPDACWFSDLRPAFGKRRFFFDEELTAILERKRRALGEDAQSA